MQAEDGELGDKVENVIAESAPMGCGCTFSRATVARANGTPKVGCRVGRAKHSGYARGDHHSGDNAKRTESGLLDDGRPGRSPRPYDYHGEAVILLGRCWQQVRI